jgi:6-pyruvoyltetrahydropterin/6-carboxytetrahydropterin synthase
MEIAGSHSLKLPYESKCSNVHGHNWIIEVTCKCEKLNAHGMVVDFAEIKRVVSRYDHANLNDILRQPTAENIAKSIHGIIPNCVKVSVQESEGNTVCYES